jgi:hypothetical protein
MPHASASSDNWQDARNRSRLEHFIVNVQPLTESERLPKSEDPIEVDIWTGTVVGICMCTNGRLDSSSRFTKEWWVWESFLRINTIAYRSLGSHAASS